MSYRSTILYRHWLEMRGALLVTGVGVVLLSLLTFAATVSRGSDVEGVALEFHAWAATAASLLAAVVLGGSGIRTNDFQPGHKSTYYTLTFPVPRSTWIVTRSVMGLGGTILPALVLLGVNALAFAVRGGPVPIVAMTRISAVAGLVALMTGVVGGVLMPVWRDWLQPLAATAVFTAFVFLATNAVNGYTPFPSWPAPVRDLASNSPDVGSFAIATVLVVIGAIRLSVVIAKRQDY